MIYTSCCSLGDDVVEFTFQLGVERRAAKMKHVLLCLRMRHKNKIRTSPQWRWPEVLATAGVKEIEVVHRTYKRTFIITDKSGLREIHNFLFIMKR
jgi:hypothetical protein